MTITLLPARPQYAEALYQVVADSRNSIARWLPWAEKLQSAADERAFLNQMMAAALAQTTYMFMIAEDGVICGAIDLHRIDADNHHAEIGYFIGEPYRGRGVVHAALQQLERFAFGERGLNKLTILVATANIPSRHVAERAGYQLEGIQRAEIRTTDGTYQDAARYSKLKSEATI